MYSALCLYVKCNVLGNHQRVNRGGEGRWSEEMNEEGEQRKGMGKSGEESKGTQRRENIDEKMRQEMERGA